MDVEGKSILIVSKDASSIINRMVNLCSVHFVGLIGDLMDLID